MPFEKILVATDFSEQAEVAVGHAISLARRFGSDLCLAHAVPLANGHNNMGYTVVAPEAYQAQAEAIRGTLRGQLEESAERVRGQGIPVDVVLVDEAPVEGIVKAVSEAEANLVVVGSHGRHGLSRLLLGSVSEGIARHAGCDILIARQQAPEIAYHRILVPTDFSELSAKALERAAQLVEKGGTVELLHCWQLPGGPATYWGEMAEGLRESIREGARTHGENILSRYAGGETKFRFTEEEKSPRRGIDKRVEDGAYDLVAMGTHRPKGLNRWLLGSVATRVIRHVDCAVYLTN